MNLKEIKDLSNEIKSKQLQLEKMIAELSEQKESKNTGWFNELEYNDKYYYITSFSNVEEENNLIMSCDINRLDVCNCFSDTNKANIIAFEQTLYRKLRKFADENNDDIDWDNGNQSKHYIYYDFNSESFRVESRYKYKEFGQMYFSSYDIAKKALDTFKDELEQYYGLK